MRCTVDWRRISNNVRWVRVRHSGLHLWEPIIFCHSRHLAIPPPSGHLPTPMPDLGVPLTSARFTTNSLMTPAPAKTSHLPYLYPSLFHPDHGGYPDTSVTTGLLHFKPKPSHNFSLFLPPINTSTPSITSITPLQKGLPRMCHPSWCICPRR